MNLPSSQDKEGKSRIRLLESTIPEIGRGHNLKRAGPIHAKEIHGHRRRYPEATSPRSLILLLPLHKAFWD